MLEKTVAEVLHGRWIKLDDRACWCEIDEEHIYCCVRPEAILHHPVAEDALFHYNSLTYEVCLVEDVEPANGERWWLIYAHPRDAVDAMAEEEWHELYGDLDLATGSGLDTGGDRDDGDHLRDDREVATREQ